MSKEIPTIAKNIKKYRAKQGISQDKLSKLAGITLHTITKIESGATPNISYYFFFVSFLFNRVDNTRNNPQIISIKIIIPNISIFISLNHQLKRLTLWRFWP